MYTELELRRKTIPRQTEEKNPNAVTTLCNKEMKMKMKMKTRTKQ